MKKLVLILIALIIGNWQLSAQTTLADNSGGKTIYFQVLSASESTAKVVQAPAGGTPYSGVVAIPATVSNGGVTYQVTSIGDNAFLNTAVTEVTIPNSVTHIGVKAFAENANLITVNWNAVNVAQYPTSNLETPFLNTPLQTVVFGATVENIPEKAFNNYTTLTAVTLGDNVKTIGANAFSNTGIATITLPKALTSIGENAFAENTRLLTVKWNAKAVVQTKWTFPFANSPVEGVEFGAEVESVPDSAFFNYTTITSIKLGNKIKTIGERAFYNTSISKINIPNDMQYIGLKAFADIETLTEVQWDAINMPRYNWTYPFNGSPIKKVVFGDDVRTIPLNSFQNCRTLTTVKLGDHVDSIGANAFVNTKISTINIPTSVTYIGDSAFAKTGISTVSIPKNVAYLGAAAFAEDTNLTTINWNAIDVAKYKMAFNNSPIATLVMGAQVESIPDSAFLKCAELKNVTFGAKLEKIGVRAFSEIAVKSITIPAAVTAIGEYAFAKNDSLTEVRWDAKKMVDSTYSVLAFAQSGIKTVLFGNFVEYIPINAFANNTTLDSIKLGNKVDSIGASAFYKTKIRQVTIPESVVYIGTKAFAETMIKTLTWEAINITKYDKAFDKAPIEKIEFGAKVVNIPDSTFYNYTKLKNVTFGAKLASIGKDAFNKTSLIEVTLPESLKKVGSMAFANTKVKTVYWDVEEADMGKKLFDKAPIETVVFGDKVTTVPDSAFYNFKKLVHVTLGDKIDTIGMNAFEGTAITEINLPQALQHIGVDAFAKNDKLVTINWNAKNIQNYVNAFDAKHVQTVVFGDSVTVIPANAFNRYGKLANVTFSDNLTTIGVGAFDSTAITTLTLPQTVTTIGDNAFANTSKLETVNWNAKDVANYSYAFLNSGVKTVVFGDSVVAIPAKAFFNDTLLATITFNENIKTIGAQAFYRAAITELNIPYSVQTIGDNAFAGDSNLTTINWNAINLEKYSRILSGAPVSTLTLGDSVSNVVANAYNGCKTLTTLTLGNGVDSLQYAAFANIPITEITVPNSAKLFWYHVFMNDTNLVTVNWNATVYDNLDTVIFKGCPIETFVMGDSVRAIGREAFANSPNLKSVTIGKNVNTIYARAFTKTKLTEIVIPDSVKMVYDNAFARNDSLASVIWNAKNVEVNLSSRYSTPFEFSPVRTVVFGEGVEAVPNKLFYYNDSLTTVTFGSNIKTIGEYAFANTNLRTVELPSSLTKIGSSAFYRDSITSLTLNENIDTIMDDAFARTSMAEVTLPESIKYIGTDAFAYNPLLKTVNWNAKKVLDYNKAFYNTNVETVIFGDAVEVIPYRAFYDNDSLRNVTMGNSIKTIGEQAFAYTMLKNVTIPTTVTTIGSYAFANNDALHQVNWNAINVATYNTNAFSATKIDTVIFGNDVTNIPNNVFENHTLLKHVVFGNSVRTIGDNAFASTAITELVLPNSVSTIGANAFYSCYNLDSVYLGSGVVAIGQSAFDACRAISFIEVKSIVPPLWYAPNAFNQVRQGIIVCVPCSVVDIYANDRHWNYFTHIQCCDNSEITVLTNDEAMGTVSGTGSYANSEEVIISANPVEGYHFVSWNDGNTENPRTIVLVADTTFTATFAINEYQISAVSLNANLGTVTGGGTYNHGETVTLEATAIAGYHFVSWNDANVENPRIVTATENVTYTATFAINEYQVNVVSANDAQGTVSGSGTFNHGTSTVIKATPAEGYRFVKWNDNNEESARTVTITSDTNFIATFELNEYQVTVVSANEAFGTVTGGGLYEHGETITLMANPTEGYHFVQWSDGITENPRIVTASAKITYTAIFAINTYQVSVASVNNAFGTVSGSGTYNHGATVTIEAIESTGYHFVRWSDGNVENPRTFTASADVNYTATFAINEYDITVASANAAFGSVSGNGTYNYGTAVLIQANPVNGYHFVSWNDGNTDNPRTITAMSDASYTASFAINEYDVTVVSSNNAYGSVAGTGTYEHGETVTLQAIATNGYHFVSWNDGNNSNPRTITATTDVTYTATFAINEYQITVLSNNNAFGTVMGSGSYNHGTSVIIEAIPVNGYHFVRWNDGIVNPMRTITATANATYTATFAINEYQINVTSNNTAYGTVTGGNTYNHGDIVTLQATAAEGYHFVSWNDGNTDNPRLFTATANANFTATFAINKYDVAVVSANPAFGTVMGSGSYDHGATVIIQAMPMSGYHFTSWNDGNTENPRTITATENATYTASFDINEYQITAESNNAAYGTVVGGGTYNYGATVTLVATAAEGYHFVRWNDGNTENPRTITANSNASYTATFAINEYEITVVSNNDDFGTVTGGGVYANGETITIQAIPAQGYKFVKWNDGNENDTRTITVSGDAIYIATFQSELTGIEDAAEIELTIYPNPTMGMLKISADNIESVEVYNMIGSKVAQFEHQNAINLSDLSAGQYTLRIVTTEGIVIRKVIKK